MIEFASRAFQKENEVGKRHFAYLCYIQRNEFYNQRLDYKEVKKSISIIKKTQKIKGNYNEKLFIYTIMFFSMYNIDTLLQKRNVLETLLNEFLIDILFSKDPFRHRFSLLKSIQKLIDKEELRESFNKIHTFSNSNSFDAYSLTRIYKPLKYANKLVKIENREEETNGEIYEPILYIRKPQFFQIDSKSDKIFIEIDIFHKQFDSKSLIYNILREIITKREINNAYEEKTLKDIEKSFTKLNNLKDNNIVSEIKRYLGLFIWDKYVIEKKRKIIIDKVIQNQMTIHLKALENKSIYSILNTIIKNDDCEDEEEKLYKYETIIRKAYDTAQRSISRREYSTIN